MLSRAVFFSRKLQLCRPGCVSAMDRHAFGNPTGGRGDYRRRRGGGHSRGRAYSTGGDAEDGDGFKRSGHNWRKHARGDRDRHGDGGGWSERGRGRGRHGGDGGERPARRGGPPPGLRGKDIGMWYASRSKQKTARQEKDNRGFVQLDESKERHISGLLESLRNSNNDHQPDSASLEHGKKQNKFHHGRLHGSRYYSERDKDSTPLPSSASPSVTNSFLSPKDFIPLSMDAGPSAGASAMPFAGGREEMDKKLTDMAESAEQNFQNSVPALGDKEQDVEMIELYDSRDREDSFFMNEYEQHKLENKRDRDEVSNSDLVGHHQELYKDDAFDELSYTNLRQKESTSRYKNMLAFRKKLPSYKMTEELLGTINSSQVTVISGETGCGKTTQVSQFLLDDAINNKRASLCRILCTQPRRISAISVAERVADERCEQCGENSVGFQIRLEKILPNTRGSILYCTTGIILKWLADNPLLAGTSHIIMDEVHERDLMSDFLMIILRDVLPRRPDLKLILMSATLNATMFSQYFDSCPMLNIPGYTFPVTDFLLEDAIEQTRFRPSQNNAPRRIFGKDKSKKQEERDRFLSWCGSQYFGQYSDATIQAMENMDHDQVNIDLACHVAEHIMRNKPEGAILVFMPGWGEIKKMHDQLKTRSVFSDSNCRIIPLHSLMPTVNQRQVFDRPPPGVRKIVIATNIAETSITIDDVVYVIDCGKIKLKTFDAENNISALKVEHVSKANARQRRGRAGRVQAGECYHLFTQYHLDNFADYQLPEMLRTRLEELCLQIKLLKLGKIEPFVQKAIEPPSIEALHASVAMLRDINALDEKEDLTPLGYHLAKMPVDPHTGKMLLFGAMFSCLDPILTVAASLSYKDAFFIPMGREKEADMMRRRLSAGSQSDHIMLVNAYQGWENALKRGSPGPYCWDHFLSSNVLRLLQDMRKQFSKLLHEMDFIPSSDPKSRDSNRNSDMEAVVKAVICAGLYPNVAKVRKVRKREGKAGSTRLTTRNELVEFSMKSVNEQEMNPITQWCVYHLKQKTMAINLYDSTFVTPLSLLLFGGDLHLSKDNQTDGCEVMIDDWITFNSSHRIANLVKELRVELDKLLEYKITHPGPTDWDPSSKEGALLRAIIDLINTEKIGTVGNRNRGHSYDADY